MILTLLFICHFSSLPVHILSSHTYYYPSLPLSYSPILSLSIHPLLPPMWTGCSDLYLSGMDESQVWFKCPNYSRELWCPALGYVAPALCLSYESWHGTTEPFTKARLRARSYGQFSPCTRPMESWRFVWKTGHMETLWPALMYPCCTFIFVWISKSKLTFHFGTRWDTINMVSTMNKYIMKWNVFQCILNIYFAVFEELKHTQ